MGIVLGTRLLRSGTREASPGRRLWGLSFGAAALAAAVGAVRHGWGPRLPPGLEWWLWYATALGIAGAGALLLAGTAVAGSRGALRGALLALAALRFAGIAAWTAAHREYLALALDSALGTALVLWVLARQARAGRFGGLRDVGAGVALGLGGALLRQLGVAPHPHFDENDLYHVVQVVSLWLIHRGGLRLGGSSHPAV